MIVCNAAAQCASLDLANSQRRATKRRRTEDGHHSQERSPMKSSPTKAGKLDQIRQQARLTAIAQARTQRTFAMLRQLISDLADDASASGIAAHAIETLAQETAASLPCQHPAHSLRYLGRHRWSGGPDPVHAAECSRALDGCGQVIVLDHSGGARAVGSGDSSRFMPSTISG
jgi:hypothetical protein